MLRKLKWQILAARYNWCQGPLPGRGPAVEKHCPPVEKHCPKVPFQRTQSQKSVLILSDTYERYGSQLVSRERYTKLYWVTGSRRCKLPLWELLRRRSPMYCTEGAHIGCYHYAAVPGQQNSDLTYWQTASWSLWYEWWLTDLFSNEGITMHVISTVKPA